MPSSGSSGRCLRSAAQHRVRSAARPRADATCQRCCALQKAARVSIRFQSSRIHPRSVVQNTHDFIQRNHVFFLFDYVGTPTLTRTLPLLKYYSVEQVVSVGPLTGADPQRLPPFNRMAVQVCDEHVMLEARVRERTQALSVTNAGLGAEIAERERAQQALTESGELVRLLLESAPEAIYGMDEFGKTTFCNASCLRMIISRRR